MRTKKKQLNLGKNWKCSIQVPKIVGVILANCAKLFVPYSEPVSAREFLIVQGSYEKNVYT